MLYVKAYRNSGIRHELANIYGLPLHVDQPEYQVIRTSGDDFNIEQAISGVGVSENFSSPFQAMLKG